jgi:hypothetical protein
MYTVDSEVRVVATPPTKNICRGFVFYNGFEIVWYLIYAGRDIKKVGTRCLASLLFIHIIFHYSLFMFHRLHHRIQIHIQTFCHCSS